MIPTPGHTTAIAARRVAAALFTATLFVFPAPWTAHAGDKEKGAGPPNPPVVADPKPLLGLLANGETEPPAAIKRSKPTPPENSAAYAPANVTENVAITEQSWDAKGRRLPTRTYGTETEGQVLGSPTASGEVSMLSSGGTSSASGCRRIDKNVVGTGNVGSNLYTYAEWTYWCWNRSSQTISNVSTGWSVSPGTFVGWEGTVNAEKVFYDYGTNDGHPRSAYKHYRKGHLKYNFPPFYNYYPELLIRSYYNGTYVWELEEA
jgi:hypothetical protein